MKPRRRASPSGPFEYLGDISVAHFLAEYWQQQPLLIRQALPDYRSPFSPEELAGFALEDEVESRLIIERPAADPLQSHWDVEHGPLAEDVFAELGDSHWTLLVQAVDQWVPELAELLHRFRFIPNWRLDDIMVSYAADGGSVGPHFDYYDVFLLQAQGTRRWRLGQTCDHASPLRQDAPMNLLTDFATAAEYEVRPGDMLYIPPGVAHWGVADGPCMTFSIGFRAPSYSDIMLDFAAELASELEPDQRYMDPVSSDRNSAPPRHPGEIQPEAAERIADILRQLTSDKGKIAHWLARYGTQAKRGAPESEVEAEATATSTSTRLRLKNRVRTAYVKTTDGAALYLDGGAYPCSLAVAQKFSEYSVIRCNELTDKRDLALVRECVANHWLVDVEQEHGCER